MTNLALPFSIHFSLSFGRTLTANFAQCGHVRDSYSIIVIGASGLPRIRSSGCTVSALAASGLVLALSAETGTAVARIRKISRQPCTFRIKDHRDFRCDILEAS